MNGVWSEPIDAHTLDMSGDMIPMDDGIPFGVSMEGSSSPVMSSFQGNSPSPEAPNAASAENGEAITSTREESKTPYDRSVNGP